MHRKSLKIGVWLLEDEDVEESEYFNSFKSLAEPGRGVALGDDSCEMTTYKVLIIEGWFLLLFVL